MAFNLPDPRPIGEWMAYVCCLLVIIALVVFAVWEAKQEWLKPRADNLIQAWQRFWATNRWAVRWEKFPCWARGYLIGLFALPFAFVLPGKPATVIIIQVILSLSFAAVAIPVCFRIWENRFGKLFLLLFGGIVAYADHILVHEALHAATGLSPQSLDTTDALLFVLLAAPACLLVAAGSILIASLLALFGLFIVALTLGFLVGIAGGIAMMIPFVKAAGLTDEVDQLLRYLRDKVVGLAKAVWHRNVGRVVHGFPAVIFSSMMIAVAASLHNSEPVGKAFNAAVRFAVYAGDFTAEDGKHVHVMADGTTATATLTKGAPYVRFTPGTAATAIPVAPASATVMKVSKP